MRKSTTLNLGAGTFVLLGFATLAFLTTQTTNRGLHLKSAPLRCDGEIRQHRRFESGRSGVHGGRRGRPVARIDLDTQEYKAVVLMRLNSKYNQIPTDSDASIYTQGLLGGKFIGLTAGGAETYLKNNDEIDFTQSAFVLENLMGQVLANFSSMPSLVRRFGQN